MVIIWMLMVLAVAGLAAADRTRLESVPALPPGWKILEETPDPNQQLKLSFALRQPEMNSVKDNIVAGLNDGGIYLSHQEAQTLRNPSEEDVNDVLNWLEENGLSGSASLDRDWIHLKTTMQRAQSLLDMTLRYYQFEGHKPMLRTQQYSVPRSIVDAIDFIHHIANFMTPKKKLMSASPGVTPGMLMKDHISGPGPRGKRAAECSQGVTPKCIRKRYKINYSTPDNTSTIRLGMLKSLF